MRNPLAMIYKYLKGQQREIFVLWFYSSVDPIWAPVYFSKFFSNSVSNSPSYSISKFVLRNGPLRRTKFFLHTPRIENLGGVGPRYYCLCTYIFQQYCPFKGYDKLLKSVFQFRAMVIGFALWPIAHNQMLRHGPQRLTKSFAMAHRGKPNPALWPIAHNQILRYGPQRITKPCAMAHSA